MRIVVADQNRGRSHELRRAVLSEGLICDSLDAVDFHHLPNRLAEAAAELVLVVCEGALSEVVEAIQAARSVAKAPILVTGAVLDAEPIRATMAAGAAMYLDLNHFQDEFRAAVAKLESDGHVPNERGRVVAIYSATGGVGATTAAINVAADMARQSKHSVALAEFKAGPGDLSLLLDIEPRFSLSSVCNQLPRLDRQMLAASMTLHGAGLHVLAGDSFPVDGALSNSPLHPELVRQLLTLLRRMYSTTVLDLDHQLDATQLEAMRLANLVTFIVRPDVPGVRRARWSLEVALRSGVSRDKFRLVLARSGQRGQLSLVKVEETLGLSVMHSIPEDTSSVNHAINQGVPLAESSSLSRINRSFATLARNVQLN
jgi:pilus assembly protein CpaE